MQAQELQQHLQQQLPECEINVAAAGNKYQILLIGEVFAGLSPVKKQQLVYSHLNDLIADGSIHAVTMKTYTPQQWQQLDAAQRQQLQSMGE